MDQKQIRFLKNLSTGLVIAAVLVAFMITGIRIFGIKIYGVQSGSMAPAHPKGALIYVRSVDPGTLKVEDVITYKLTDGTTSTHRIVEVVTDPQYPTRVQYRTKGDANKDVDGSLVSASNIIGKVMFSIPHLGTFASYIQQPPGIYVAIIVCGLLIAFVFYTDSLETKLKEKEKQEPGSDPAPVSDKPPFDLAASINKISQKLFKKDLIKVKEADEPAFQRGYTPPQPTPQPMQYAQQQPQQPYPGMQQQYPQQGYSQYPQQPYPQQVYQQQPYQGMQQQYPQQGYQYPQQSYPQQMYQQPYQGMQQQYPQQGAQQMRAQQMGGQPQYYPMQGQQQLPVQQPAAMPQTPVHQAQQSIPPRPVSAGGMQQSNPVAPQQHIPKH